MGSENHKLPDLRSIPEFSGSESAARWLSKLHWQFELVGHPAGALPANEVIRAINMLCSAEAATFLDNDQRLQTIVERSGRRTATPEDLELVEQSLRDKFPAKFIDVQITQEEDLTRFEQKVDEPLTQYYSRIVNALRKAGVQDRPKGSEGMSTAEATLLRSTISKFVEGLRDFKLKEAAIGQRARLSDTLGRCLETIQETQSILEDRERVAKAEADRAHMEQIELALKRNGGSYDKAVQSVGPPQMYLSHSGSQLPFSGNGYYQPPMYQQGQQQSFSNFQSHPVQHPFPNQYQQYSAQYPVQTPNSFPLPNSQPQYFQQNNADNRPYSVPSQGQNRPQRGCFKCGKEGHMIRDCPENNTVRNGNAREAPRGMADTDLPTGNPKIPDRSKSSNPYVNGTLVPERGQRVCFRCGTLGHDVPACEAMKPKWLQPWEQAHLRAVVSPARRYKANSSLLESDVVSRSAQLYYELNMRDEPTLEVSSSCALVDVSALESISIAPDEEVEAEMVVMQAYISNLLEKQAGKKRKGGDGAAIPISSLLDNDEEVPRRKEKTSTEDVGKKTSQSRKPRKVKDPDEPPRPLNPIRSRKDDGPFDYRHFLKNTPITLTLEQLAQASPDFIKNFKHWSARQSERVTKKQKRMADGMEVLQSTCSKSFRLTPTLTFQKDGEVVTVTLEEDSGHADQGSDVNIIAPTLVDRVGIPRRSLSQIGLHKGLGLTNSSGRIDTIVEFVIFNVTVESIKRTMWALIQPPGGRDTTLLLFGLPWLYDVYAQFNIRENYMVIGSKEVDKFQTIIQGPVMTMGPNHKLSLIPGVADESDSEEDSGNSESDGSDSESEN